MENLKIYEATRTPPKEALKDFDNGSFKGTDINTMWRIKKLTELYGACGVGWYYTIDRTWTDSADDSVMAFADISLYTKNGGEWSKPIAGTGGNKFSYKTKQGYVKVSDECYKMAITDALGNACRSLGFGADVYWANDKTKYTEHTEITETAKEFKKLDVETAEYKMAEDRIYDLGGQLGLQPDKIAEFFEKKYKSQFYKASLAELKTCISDMEKAVEEKAVKK